MSRRLVPAIIVLGLVALLIYQLLGEGQAECTVCVVFKGGRQCSTVVGPTKEVATEEAHRTACSQLAKGVTDSFACPNVAPVSTICK